jgi:hypothetical protein
MRDFLSEAAKPVTSVLNDMLLAARAFIRASSSVASISSYTRSKICLVSTMSDVDCYSYLLGEHNPNTNNEEGNSTLTERLPLVKR